MTADLWTSPLGREVLAIEAAALAPVVRRLHGDVALWAGAHIASADALHGCMVRHAVFLQPGSPRSQHPDLSCLGAELEALPFKSNSLDGIVLHHALEQTRDPRVALREATRVLMPGGRLVICTFNPLSLLGVRRLYARTFQDALSAHRLVNPLRLFDWLTLLGFELDVKPFFCGYGLPFKRLVRKFDLPWLEQREHSLNPGPTLPFGSVMVLSAVKQAVSARPQGPMRLERRRLAPVAYPSVASWQKIKS